MAEQNISYSILKTFSGLIYRQAIFTSDLNVDSYHLTFLDKHGQLLPADVEAPKFVHHLPQILLEIGLSHRFLLTIPASWHAILKQSPADDIEITLEVDDKMPVDVSNVFNYAGKAGMTDRQHETQMLLIDLKQFGPGSIRQHLADWREQYKTLCATNVNTLEQYQFCKKNELNLLQGVFYSQPQTGSTHKTSPSEQILSQLLVKLHDPHIEPEDLAATINPDVSLSYKLLRLINNSAFFGMQREISSIKEAIVFLGLNKVKTWACMVCLSGMNNKLGELSSIAMTRAIMCELLAKYYKGQPEVFFFVGMFSIQDALLDKPLEEIIANLPLTDVVRQALVEKRGPAGHALQDVLHYEYGYWKAMDKSALPTEILGRTYLDAVHWSTQLMQQLSD